MSRIARLIRITGVFFRYRLDTLAHAANISGWPRALLRFGPWRLVPVRADRAVRLRRALEDLGPVFIKFGQAISTRRDLLPTDIADELEKLQDQVPPFDSAAAVALIETSLGAPVDELFAEFEHQPLASASVAQVHAATLKSGENVVVKVVRPGIERVIRKDIALLYTLAHLVARYLPDGARLKPVEVVADYEITILDELDLQREAGNTSQLRRNFEDSRLAYVPEVYWDLTRRDVFTMERISGIPVTDVEALRERGVNLKLLAERGVEIFFTQVFRDSFFHADMHPGNIFVDASDPEDPRYIAVDCAIIGTLDDFDQYYLARNLLAIFRRDYRECAQLHVECGWVPPYTRVQDFESAMRSVCEPVFEKPIAEISFGQLLIYLFNTARRFNMEVQPSLVLLQKTLLNIEGLGRQLYPQLDLWNTAQPYLENWLRERYSPLGMIERLRKDAPSLLEQLPYLPGALMDSLRNNRGGRPRPPMHPGRQNYFSRNASPDAYQNASQHSSQHLSGNSSRYSSPFSSQCASPYASQCASQYASQHSPQPGARRRSLVRWLLALACLGAATTLAPQGLEQIARWPTLSLALLALGALLLLPRRP